MLNSVTTLYESFIYVEAEEIKKHKNLLMMLLKYLTPLILTNI